MAKQRVSVTLNDEQQQAIVRLAAEKEISKDKVLQQLVEIALHENDTVAKTEVLPHVIAIAECVNRIENGEDLDEELIALELEVQSLYGCFKADRR